MSMNKYLWSILSFVFWLVVSNSLRVLQQQPSVQATIVPLNKPISFNQIARQNKYFQSTVANPDSTQLLMITISADIKTYIRIYVSTSDSDKFDSKVCPSYESYNQQCFYSIIDTCAIKMPDSSSLSPSSSGKLTIYFTVVVGSDCNYVLDVTLQKVFSIAVNKNYTITFNKSQSTMVELNSSNWIIQNQSTTYQQIVVSCMYSSFKDIGQFQILAQQGQYPRPGSYEVIKSQSVYALAQIIKLPVPSSPNASYFIMFQGQNSTKLNFSVHPIQSLLNPTISANQTLTYITSSQIVYSYSQPFGQQFTNASQAQQNIKPLFIQLFAYRGSGKFVVNYCNINVPEAESGNAQLDKHLGHNFTFQSLGGESADIQISVENRLQCYQNIQKYGGLLVENMQIQITQVIYEFGYTVGLYEGQYENYLIIGVKQLAVLQDNTDIDTYNVDVYGNTSNITLTAQIYTGSVFIQAQQCNSSGNISKCIQLSNISLSQADNQVDKLLFSCAQKTKCLIKVSQLSSNSSYSKYSIIMTLPTPITEVFASTPVYNVIQMNQYQYYFINVSALRNNPTNKFSNSTMITIKNTVINGQTIMLTSSQSKDKVMVFKDMWVQGSVIKYAWEGQTKYVVNSTYPVGCCLYIAIMGNSQSIYNVQYTFNTTANIPDAYQDLVQGTSMNFIISTDNPYVLIKYRAHIIPYTITFTPVPSCIRYGQKLPFSQNCTSSSQYINEFHEQIVYFNVTQGLSNNEDVFKFSIFVNSGVYKLQQGSPIVIGCQNKCWETVQVIINNKGQSAVIHTGDGFIQQSNTTNKSQIATQKISNKAMILTCANPPCQYLLNASLSFVGSMQLSLQSSLFSRPLQISWRTKPFRLPSILDNTPKYFYMHLPKYYSSSYSYHYSVIFYSAADLTVYYNVIALNENYTNVANYSFPKVSFDNDGTARFAYMGVSYGDPLKQIHIVDIDQQILDDNKCSENKIVCILTISAVLNKTVQYSNQYLQSGLGYVSSNLYSYAIYPTQPILNLKQSYSLSYYSYSIDFSSSTSPASIPFRIHLQSLSNCRPNPYIQTENTNYINDYYTGVRLPRVMPGQSTINYRIISNDICRYSTAITNVPYQLVFPNLQQRVLLDKNTRSVVFVYQHTLYQYKVTIQLKQPVQSIVVKEVSYTPSAETYQPTLNLPSINPPNYIQYTQNSSTLSFIPPSISQYLIKITYPLYSPPHTPSSISVLVKTQTSPTILLHNQESVFTYDPNDNSIDAQATNNGGKAVYQFYSVNSFYIFVTVNRWKLNVKVYNKESAYSADENTKYIVNKVIGNTSQPWIYINASSSDASTNVQSVSSNLIAYIIQCQYIPEYIQTSPTSPQKSTLKIHIEEEGIKGLQQLYQGIVAYDAFIHENAMNCYVYNSGFMLGEDTFAIDINFRNMPSQLNSGTNTSILVSSARILPTSQSMYPAPIMHNKLTRISDNTFRLVLSYYVNSQYKICYTLSSAALPINASTSSLSLVGVQYSVIVNAPSMPVLYDNLYPQKEVIDDGIYRDMYQMFQYVNDKRWAKTNPKSQDDINNNEQNEKSDQYYDGGVYQQQDKNIIVSVINCAGSSIVLGSSSYTDMLTGKMTDLTNIYSNNGKSSVSLTVPHGYYYFGVRSSQLSILQLFRVELQPALPAYQFARQLPSSINPSSIVPYSLYTINWLMIPTVSTQLQANIQYLVVKVPPVIKVNSASVGQTGKNGGASVNINSSYIPSPSKIVYKLYVLNIITNANPESKNKLIRYQYNIDEYVRCPGLWNNGTHSGPNNTNINIEPVQIITIENHYSQSKNRAQDAVVFKVPLISIQKQSNISIKAEVYINNEENVLSYYYGQDQLYVTNSNEGISIWSPIKWIFIICMTLVGVGGIAFFVRYYIRKINMARDIQFQQQMNAPNPTNDQAQREVEMETRTNNDNLNNNESITSSNRRPLNKDVGYGEFVDEA